MLHAIIYKMLGGCIVFYFYFYFYFALRTMVPRISMKKSVNRLIKNKRPN